MKIMKTIIKSLLLVPFILLFSSTFAASIDHFEVTMEPVTAKVGETIDITIEAVDIDNNTITDYRWAILVFSESDPEADFPNVLKENSYTFEASDEWKIKFENAVKFQTIWIQDIHVYELENDTVVWIAEVEILWEELVNNVDIEILSPESWITIWEDKITVSWLTNKNYTVKVKLNDKHEFETTSNGEWIFEAELRWLEQWNNTIYAEILDADWNVLWLSSEVNIRIESNKPRIRNLSITPNWEVKSESKLDIEIISNVGLDEVSVVINDILIWLEEIWEWVYKVTTTAPKEAWSYSVDTILRDEIWHETKELWVEVITVLASEWTDVEVLVNEEPEDNKEVVEVTNNENAVEAVITTCTTDTKVTWLKLTQLKTKSILNWNSVKDATKYNVYKKLDDGSTELIKTVNEPVFTVDIIWDDLKYEYFAVKAICMWEDDEEFEWTLSDATKIQTWPELIILWLLSLLFWWLLVFYRKRA